MKINNQKIEKDWHRSDIRTALEKKGMSLRQLSRDAGLAEDTLRNALARKWPKGEQIIADALGVSPAEIWPSRYIVSPPEKKIEEQFRENLEKTIHIKY